MLVGDFKNNLDMFDQECFYCGFTVNAVLEAHHNLINKEGKSLNLLTE
jgi:hypothetical protein